MGNKYYYGIYIGKTNAALTTDKGEPLCGGQTCEVDGGLRRILDYATGLVVNNVYSVRMHGSDEWFTIHGSWIWIPELCSYNEHKAAWPNDARYNTFI